MNFFSNYRFTLDIQKGKSQVSIPVHYGDTGNRFYITFTDGGNPYTIPDGCRVDLYMKKPNNRPLVNACIIENNAVVRYEFNKNTASVTGMHKCELRLYSGDGRLITSPSFVMVVDERVIFDDEIGTEEDLQKLIAMDVIAQEEKRIEAEYWRDEAEKERKAAENVREEAETAREEAEVAREEAEKARADAEKAREEAKAAVDAKIEEIDAKFQNYAPLEDGKVPSSALPSFMADVSVTAEDNGKILQVVDGAWSAVLIQNAEGGSF